MVFKKMSAAYAIMSVEGLLVLLQLLFLSKRSFSFLWKKDRLLLWHFIFLLCSIVFRILSVLLPLIDSLATQNKKGDATTIELFRNFFAYGALNFFFLACALNLLKWFNLIFYLKFKSRFQEHKYEKQKKKNNYTILAI